MMKERSHRTGQNTNVQYHKISDQLHLAIADNQNLDYDSTLFFSGYVKVADHVSYNQFCDDFGPMNMATMFHFCELIDKQLKCSCGYPVVIISTSETKLLTNTILLIGSYMVMHLDLGLEAVTSRLRLVLPLAVPFRDVSPGEPNFDLRLLDCWGGLLRAKQLSWIDFGEGPSCFDPEQYAHYDSPLNADLNDIVPGKLIAMRGPIAIPGGREYDDEWDSEGRFSHRNFAPAHYTEILREFGVRAVVRLCEARYDSRELEARGVAVVELPFEDCSPPPPDVVARFLAVAEAVPGALAVHGKAGLGRTGTLIALYMMKHHGFTAREAIGWLRIVRPGSVIGEQQQYLCEMEGVMRGTGQLARYRRSIVHWHPPPTALPASGDSDGDGGGGTSPSAAAGEAAGIAEVHRLIAAAEERAARSMARNLRRPARRASDVPGDAPDPSRAPADSEEGPHAAKVSCKAAASTAMPRAAAAARTRLAALTESLPGNNGGGCGTASAASLRRRSLVLPTVAAVAPGRRTPLAAVAAAGGRRLLTSAASAVQLAAAAATIAGAAAPAAPLPSPPTEGGGGGGCGLGGGGRSGSAAASLPRMLGRPARAAALPGSRRVLGLSAPPGWASFAVARSVAAAPLPGAAME